MTKPVISETYAPQNLLSTDERPRVALPHEILALVETMIGHEFALIGNRMTWLSISQSFLFGAYASIATDPHREGVFRSLTSSRESGDFTADLILFLVPVVGALFAFAARRGVSAAQKVLEDLMECRGALTEKINFGIDRRELKGIPILGISSQRPKHLQSTVVSGDLPLVLLPWGMGLIWATVLLIRLPWQDWFKAFTSTA
jgi:hypothetical protein